MSGTAQPVQIRANTHSHSPQPSYKKQLRQIAYKVAVWSGTCALTAYAIGTSPVAGAIFGAGVTANNLLLNKFVLPYFQKPSPVVIAACCSYSLLAADLLIPTAIVKTAGFSLSFFTRSVPLLISGYLVECIINPVPALQTYVWASTNYEKMMKTENAGQ